MTWLHQVKRRSTLKEADLYLLRLDGMDEKDILKEEARDSHQTFCARISGLVYGYIYV